jgi:hypothetical protein
MSLFTLGSARAILVVALVYSFPDVFNVIMALISPYTNQPFIDGLASFLETTLTNGVKVVEKVTTSKFRFHLIAMHWGVFANSAAHLYQNYLEEHPPNPRETSERMNFNVIDKKNN